MDIFKLIIPMLIGYIFGSIPYGFLLVKYIKKTNIQTQGSKNIGATNVLRVAGKKIAIITLLLDLFKGYIAIIIAVNLFKNGTNAHHIAFIAGVSSILGHMFPVWLKFQGGKGIATFIGILLYLSPILFIIMVLGWLFCYYMFQISSLSALIAVSATFISGFIFNDYFYDNLYFFLMYLLIIYKHKDNIIRLVNKEESAIK